MAINARLTGNGFYLHLGPCYVRLCLKTNRVLFGAYGKARKEFCIGELENLLTPNDIDGLREHLEQRTGEQGI